MKRKLIILCCLLSTFVIAQEKKNYQSFHFGLAGISSFTTSTVNNHETSSINPLGFGVYVGNLFKIKEQFILDLEFFYLDNKVEIGRKDNYRFELHQNIGFNLKPGIVIKNHTLFIQAGLSAVYVFDKNENTENDVIDRFDDAIFYGLSYDYRIHKNVSVQVGYLHAKFNSISHWTDHELNKFSVLSLSAIFHLE